MDVGDEALSARSPCTVGDQSMNWGANVGKPSLGSLVQLIDCVHGIDGVDDGPLTHGGASQALITANRTQVAGEFE